MLTASLRDPLIASVLEGELRFANAAQARQRFDKIAREYMRLRTEHAPDGTAQAPLVLWIRGYGISGDEKEQGYRGQYAKVWIVPLPGGKFTLAAEKMDVALDRHPERQRPKERMPDSGHPILRAAERGKTYSGIAEARVELRQLHEEYPLTTIPLKDRLHVMLYSRKEEGGERVKKITLSIQPLMEGGAKLIISEKRRRKQLSSVPETAPKGKFTRMVKKRKKI